MHAGNYKPESYTGAYQYSISSVTKTTAEGAVLALRLLISLNDHALSSESSSSSPMVLDSKVVLIGPELVLRLQLEQELVLWGLELDFGL